MLDDDRVSISNVSVTREQAFVYLLHHLLVMSARDPTDISKSATGQRSQRASVENERVSKSAYNMLAKFSAVKDRSFTFQYLRKLVELSFKDARLFSEFTILDSIVGIKQTKKDRDAALALVESISVNLPPKSNRLRFQCDFAARLCGIRSKIGQGQLEMCVSDLSHFILMAGEVNDLEMVSLCLTQLMGMVKLTDFQVTSLVQIRCELLKKVGLGGQLYCCHLALLGIHERRLGSHVVPNSEFRPDLVSVNSTAAYFSTLSALVHLEETQAKATCDLYVRHLCIKARIIETSSNTLSASERQQEVYSNYRRAIEIASKFSETRFTVMSLRWLVQAVRHCADVAQYNSETRTLLERAIAFASLESVSHYPMLPQV